MMEATGSTVLVTGGARGIGKAIVESFLRLGTKLAIILDIDETTAGETFQVLRVKYGYERVEYIKCDVTKDVDDAYEKVVQRYKYVDILVNNAGILDDVDYNRTIDVNTKAVIACSLKFHDRMRRDRGGKGGTIINISSICGYKTSPFVPCYAASKFAVIGFSKSLGHNINYERTGVRVVAICPGKVFTAMTASTNIRDKELLPDFIETLSKLEGQSPDDFGRETTEVFQRAESGEVWLIEGGRPAERLNINNEII